MQFFKPENWFTRREALMAGGGPCLIEQLFDAIQVIPASCTLSVPSVLIRLLYHPMRGRDSSNSRGSLE